RRRNGRRARGWRERRPDRSGACLRPEARGAPAAGGVRRRGDERRAGVRHLRGAGRHRGHTRAEHHPDRLGRHGAAARRRPRAGLKPGDVVVAVDGAPVRSVEGFLERIWPSGGRPLAFQVLRGGAPRSVTIVPDTASGVDPQYPKRPHSYGFIGAQVQPGVTRVRKPPGKAIVSGWQETTRTATIILGFLKGLVLGQISVRELGGPILVAQASGQAARLGIDWL